jgi:competence protein ComEC
MSAFVRYNFALPNFSDEYLSYYNGKNYVFEGIISTEPDIRIDSARYIVEPRDLEGKVYIKTELYPRYDYGDYIKITCNLKKPEPIEDFRYDMYLARYGVVSICFNPEIDKISSGGGNFFLKNILYTKEFFAEKINKLWHEPYAGFMSGLLYGYRGGLGDLQEDFNRTGVTHIVAISGYNISIIAIILSTLFVHLWIPRKKAFWIISFGIFLFVIFTGASGSVVRAGIMGFFVLLSRQLGRLNSVGNIMALTAVVMTIHNPFVLFWDAGFQLSFLATLGLVYISPILQNRFKKMPEFIGLKESFVSTVSAIIATLPLILFQFGRLSVVAPIVNVLILWLIPWIMMFGFFAVLFSFIFYPFGQIVSWVAWVFMKYITSVVEWFSGLSFASVEIRTPFYFVIFLYFLIYIIFFNKKYKTKKQLN